MALAGLREMLSGALRDRVAAAGVLLVAGVLLLMALVLAVAALVTIIAAYLGTVRALLAVAGGLVVLALLLVWITSARNRRAAEIRATTRALWAATAVNAASSILRGGAKGHDDGSGTSGGTHRSAFLIAGGLALMLLAFLVPGGGDKGGDKAGDKGPEDPETGPDDPA